MKTLLLCAVLIASSTTSFAATTQTSLSPFKKAITAIGYNAKTKIFDCTLEIDSDIKKPVAVCTMQTTDGNVGIVVFGKLKINSAGQITKAIMISHDAD